MCAGLDYYDLYLIHWPNPKQDMYLEAWQALIDAKKWGLIRSIGVCNFLPEHIERISPDRKSTRLNSSHVASSYAVFCSKKKKVHNAETHTNRQIRPNTRAKA